MSRRSSGPTIVVACVLLACGATPISRSNPPTTASAASADPAPPPSNKEPPEVDVKGLPKDGPGDPTLTYDVVAKDPAKYRGKRVAWAFDPCSAEGARMMCALKLDDAIGPRHSGIYVARFESEKEAQDVFLAGAEQPGGTITGTVVGQIDQFLVVKGADGTAQKDIPKITVPLLVFPTYHKAEAAKDKK